MIDTDYKKSLAKIVLTLQSRHHGCSEEALNIALDALGVSIEHNTFREMLNIVTEEEVESFVKSIS